MLAADWDGTAPKPPRASDLLLEGLAYLTTEGYDAGAPRLKRAVDAFLREPMSDEDALRWLWLACHIARTLGDDAGWDELTERQVQVARRSGGLSILPAALHERFRVELYRRESPGGDGAGSGGGRDDRRDRQPRRSARCARAGCLAWARRRGRRSRRGGPRRGVATRRGHVADRERVDASRALQRPRTLGGRPRSSRVGRGAAERARLVDLDIGGAGRGGRTERQARARCRCARPILGDGARHRNRLGVGHRGEVPRLAERRRGRRRRVSGGDRPAREDPHPRHARARPSRLRRVASARESPRRRPRRAAGSTRHVRRHGIRAVRRARPA